MTTQPQVTRAFDAAGFLKKYAIIGILLLFVVALAAMTGSASLKLPSAGKRAASCPSLVRPTVSRDRSGRVKPSGGWREVPLQRGTETSNAEFSVPFL